MNDHPVPADPPSPWTIIHDNGFSWDDVNALAAIYEHHGWADPDAARAPDAPDARLRALRDEYASLSLPLGSTREAAKHERDTALYYIDRILASSPAPADNDSGGADGRVPSSGHVASATTGTDLGPSGLDDRVTATAPAPAGLDEERLAAARHATWPDCIEGVPWQQCGAVNHRFDAEQLAAEYARAATRPAEDAQ